MGADEVSFILAEAAVRGWSVAKSADAYYKEGIQFAIQKYPSNYPGADFAQAYMDKYTASTGNAVDYDAMMNDYILNPEVANATLENILFERWKSSFMNGYEAFSIQRRSGIPSTVLNDMSGLKEVDLPAYDKADGVFAGDFVFGQALPTAEFNAIPYHNGGATGGIRPQRLDYPNAERTKNAANIEAAIDNQAANGNDGSHWLSTKMWYSKK